MRFASLLAGFCFLAIVTAARAQSDATLDSLSKSETVIQTQAEASKAMLVSHSPLEIPGKGKDLSCVNTGWHTEKLPDFEPMGPDCDSDDPLPTPESVKKSWNALVALLMSSDLPATSNGDGVQKLLSRGTADYKALDETHHWGDLLLAQFANKGGRLALQSVLMTTYRAMLVKDEGGSYVTATRWDFQFDGDGNPTAFIDQSGVQQPGERMEWAPKQVNSYRDIKPARWHQFLQSWTYGQKL